MNNSTFFLARDKEVALKCLVIGRLSKRLAANVGNYNLMRKVILVALRKVVGDLTR
jgi:hypothetical protein